MAEASPAPSKPSALQALFAQIEAADSPELALVRLVLESAGQRDAELPDLLRACAIPRRFDAQTVGVLRGAPEDEERNRQLLAMVCAHSFVLRHPVGGYVYHDNTRDVLLEDWRSTGDKQAKFAELNLRLATFYMEKVTETAQAQRDLAQLSSVIRGANVDRYRRFAASIEARFASPLLEALYHRLLASTPDGFGFFRNQFHDLEEAGSLALCQSLISVTRDFLQRLPNEQRDPQWFDWLDYFEARIIRQLPPYNYERAEQMLRRIVERQEHVSELQRWALNDLAISLENQLKLKEAVEVRRRLVGLPEEIGEDVYNLPVYHSGLGKLYWMKDELDQATEHFRRSIEMSERLSEARSDIQVYSRLGLSEIYATLGRWREAFEAANEALYLTRTQFRGDRNLQSLTAHRFMSLLSTFDVGATETLATEYIELTVGRPLSRLEAIRDYIDVLRDAGRESYAEIQLQRLNEEVQQSDDRQHFLIQQLLLQALIADDRGRIEEANTTYTEILEQTRDRQDARWQFAAALSNRGMKRTLQSNWLMAEEDLHTAIQLWEDFGFTGMVANIQTSLARLLRRRGMLEEAQSQLEQTASIFLSDANSYVQKFHLVQGEVYRDQGLWREAQSQYERALQHSLDRQMLGTQLHALHRLSDIALEQIHWAVAASYATQAAALTARLAELDSYRPTQVEDRANRMNVEGIRVFSDQTNLSAALNRACDMLRSAIDNVPQNFWYHLNISFVYAEREEWQEAATSLIRGLELCPAPMRTIRLYQCWRDYAVKQAETIHRNGDSLSAAELMRETLTHLQRHLPIADLVDMQLHLGDYYVMAGRPADAQRAYVSASEHTETGQYTGLQPDQPLASRLQSLLRDPAQYWDLDDTLYTWATDAETPQALRDELVSTRAALTTYLDTAFKLHADAASENIQVVTPIVVEVGDSLVPIVDSRQDGGKFLFELIPAMRNRIESDIGITVPGVRMRGGSLLPNDYSIQIDEVPTVSGTVYANMWFVVGAPRAPGESKSLSRPLTDTHPLTGAPGTWVNQEQADADRADGRELVPAPLFLVYRIEAVLRQNLGRFFGLQEAAMLLETWETEAGGRDLVMAALPDQRARVRLTWLLRALLREYVPITNWRALLEGVRDAGGASALLDNLVRATRLRLRDQLPGNAPGTARIRLPEEYEQQMLGHTNGRAFFAATPQQKHEFLIWLRQEMQTHSRSAVLVTGRYELRPLLSRLIEPEFPEMTVLSEEELIERSSIH